MLHSINYCMCVFLKFICIYFFLYYRGPCVRKLFTGLIMYLPSQNNEHCIVLYCRGENELRERIPMPGDNYLKSILSLHAC